MKISVITAVLNGAQTLENTIESIHQQNYKDIEHIVVDGGSTDGTVEIAARHSDKIACFIPGPDHGIYDGMNKGIERATGDVIGFLNSDDYYSDNSVVDQINRVFQDQTVDACYADLLYVDGQNTDKVIRYFQSGEYRSGLFERGWIPAHPTFYARKEIYEKYGLFDSSLKFQADLEHTARVMAVHRVKTRYVSEIWVCMRTGGATNRSISNILKGNLESYRAFKKLGLKVSPVYFATKFMMRVPQFFKVPARKL